MEDTEHSVVWQQIFSTATSTGSCIPRPSYGEGTIIRGIGWRTFGLRDRGEPQAVIEDLHSRNKRARKAQGFWNDEHIRRNSP